MVDTYTTELDKQVNKALDAMEKDSQATAYPYAYLVGRVLFGSVGADTAIRLAKALYPRFEESTHVTTQG